MNLFCVGGQWSEDNFCELVFFFYHKSLGIWLRLGNGDFIRWAMSHHKPLLVLKDSSDFEAPTWFIFMCVSEQVCTYVCVCIEARSLTLGVFLFCCLPCFWDRDSQWRWSPLVFMYWLTSKLQGSSCLHTPSTEIASIHNQAHIFIWVLGIKLRS